MPAFGRYHAALARAVAGDLDGAEELFSGGADGTAMRLTRRGTIARAQVLSQLGRNDEAVALVDESFGADLEPGLAALRARLAEGDTVPFDLVSDATDGAAEVFFTVAGALRGEAQASYTLLYTRAAEALRPDHVDAILMSASLLDQMERYDLATETYNRVPRDHPSFHIAEIGRAEALEKSGREDAAIQVLGQLAESHGDQAIVHITQGDMLRRLERYAEATPAYDRAIALFSEDREEHWVVYFARGITQEREDRWPAAEADFRKALELNPGQPSVLNYLGYSFIEMEENLEEAMEMIREAVAARPDSGHIVDSLGWGLYRLGRYEEAVEHMERAAELLPVDPIVNDHLGDVYWAVGRKVEARFQWHRALSFDPEPEEAERIRRKLEVGLDQVLAEEGAPPLEVAGEDVAGDGG
jgi:tetratricopeptide (TPR) repeat protein